MFKINNDQASAAVWFVAGLTITIASVPYGLGTRILQEPGSCLFYRAWPSPFSHSSGWGMRRYNEGWGSGGSRRCGG